MCSIYEYLVWRQWEHLEGWRGGFTPTPTCETQNGEACRELPPWSPAASPGIGGFGMAGLPRGRDPARDPWGSCSNLILPRNFLLGFQRRPKSWWCGVVWWPPSFHSYAVLRGPSSTEARLETESYPQPEDDKVLSMGCALMVGFLPGYKCSLSHGDLGPGTCFEPLSPAVRMELQMNTWSMLLTRAVFLASFADTPKKPHYPGKASAQCAAYGWSWAVGEPAASKDHISPGLCSSKGDHNHVLCL